MSTITDFARNNTAVAGAAITAAAYNSNWSTLETFLNSTGVHKYQDNSIDPSADINWSTNFTNVNVPLQTVQAHTASGNITRAGGQVVTFAGAASQTLTLPAAAAGLAFEIHNIDTADAVTIARAGSDTINGGTSITLWPGDRVRVMTTAAAAWTATFDYFPWSAAMYVANSGSPTHNSAGNAQKVGAGGGTVTWTSSFDVRPNGVSAQVDTATNKRIDIRRTGVYLVEGVITFGAIADAKPYGVSIYQNGAEVGLRDDRTSGVANIATSRCSALVSLTTGDYLELYAYHNDGATEAYSTTYAHYNGLKTTFVGPAS